jgi:hypothetical protein
MDFKDASGRLIGQSPVIVDRGRFTAGPFTAGYQSHPRGDYSIVIDSPMNDMQPKAVRKLLGHNGKNLRGPLAVYQEILTPGWVIHFEAPVVIR